MNRGGSRGGAWEPGLVPRPCPQPTQARPGPGSHRPPFRCSLPDAQSGKSSPDARPQTADSVPSACVLSQEPFAGAGPSLQQTVQKKTGQVARRGSRSDTNKPQTVPPDSPRVAGGCGPLHGLPVSRRRAGPVCSLSSTGKRCLFQNHTPVFKGASRGHHFSVSLAKNKTTTIKTSLLANAWVQSGLSCWTASADLFYVLGGKKLPFNFTTQAFFFFFFFQDEKCGQWSQTPTLKSNSAVDRLC